MDARRQVPRTDAVLADPRLASALRRFDRAVVKGAVVAAHPGALLAIKYAGAAYLLWLAWKSWRAGPADPSARGTSTRWSTPTRSPPSACTSTPRRWSR